MAKIKYLAHPVSKSDKADWNKKGYQIVDARFEPETAEQEVKPKKKAVKKKAKK
jgi:hypothetical protein